VKIAERLLISASRRGQGSQEMTKWWSFNSNSAGAATDSAECRDLPELPFVQINAREIVLALRQLLIQQCTRTGSGSSSTRGERGKGALLSEGFPLRRTKPQVGKQASEQKDKGADSWVCIN